MSYCLGVGIVHLTNRQKNFYDWTNCYQEQIFHSFFGIRLKGKWRRFIHLKKQITIRTGKMPMHSEHRPRWTYEMDWLVQFEYSSIIKNSPLSSSRDSINARGGSLVLANWNRPLKTQSDGFVLYALKLVSAVRNCECNIALISSSVTLSNSNKWSCIIGDRLLDKREANYFNNVRGKGL